MSELRSAATRSSKFRIVCAPTTVKHLACIRALVSPNDNVLVVCSPGSGDAGAAEEATGGRAADGNDASLASEADSRVAVSHGSVWDVASLLTLQGEVPRHGFTIACLDMTTCGHMLVADCHALLRMLQSVFEATLHTVLVKSKALERHSRCFHNSHRFLQSGLPWHHVCNDVQVICRFPRRSVRGGWRGSDWGSSC